jgi:hypothetical protein
LVHGDMLAFGAKPRARARARNAGHRSCKLARQEENPHMSTTTLIIIILVILLLGGFGFRRFRR